MLEAFQNKPNAADTGFPAFAVEGSWIIQARIQPDKRPSRVYQSITLCAGAG